MKKQWKSTILEGQFKAFLFIPQGTNIHFQHLDEIIINILGFGDSFIMKKYIILVLANIIFHQAL